MQTAPVLPELFQELIVQPEDSLRVRIVKVFIRTPVLVYKVAKWAIKPDGSGFTIEFRNWVCEGCERGIATTETTT